MGFGGISIWQLLIILLVVVLVFGTKKLSHIGSDLGSAISSFKKAMHDSEEESQQNPAPEKEVQKKDEKTGSSE